MKHEFIWVCEAQISKVHLFYALLQKRSQDQVPPETDQETCIRKIRYYPFKYIDAINFVGFFAVYWVIEAAFCSFQQKNGQK